MTKTLIKKDLLLIKAKIPFWFYNEEGNVCKNVKIGDLFFILKDGENCRIIQKGFLSMEYKTKMMLDYYKKKLEILC